MWTKKVLLALAVLLAIGLSHGEGQDNDVDLRKVPIFVESMRNLHRGPPVLPIQTRAEVRTEWIEQKLDHFDETEERTWQMRYMVNDELFQAGGPIFIYVGGEWEISAGSISGGHLYDMAKEHNAILYYTEHRYYGASRPTSDLKVENLDYLHIKQALADLAHFINQMKQNEALANAKVFIAGGSYSATMVVWFRRLYPELIVGGWASSAPILAQVDFREYKEVVGRAILELGGQQCYNRIKNGIAELEDMFANQRGAEAKAMMKICNNFNEYNDLDLWSLFGSISNVFAGVVQYQRGQDVPNVCNYLMSFDEDVVAIASYMLRYAVGGCIDFTYKDTITFYMDSTYASGASRPWYYQTCNEYGWYQSSGSAAQPFGTKFPAALYTTLCYDVFGEKFTNEFIQNSAAQTNNEFGGKQPNVDHIFMTHGDLDPWNPMGHGVAEGATVIPLASHCNDFTSISANDSAEMRAAKEHLAQLVREWLAE